MLLQLSLANHFFRFPRPAKKVIFNVNAVSVAECFRILVVLETSKLLKYRKIPKISPGAYIFRRPFSRDLFLEGIIFGGVIYGRNLRFKISWACLIVGSKFTVFALFYFVFKGNFSSTSPRGLIFGGAI